MKKKLSKRDKIIIAVSPLAFVATLLGGFAARNHFDPAPEPIEPNYMIQVVLPQGVTVNEESDTIESPYSIMVWDWLAEPGELDA